MFWAFIAMLVAAALISLSVLAFEAGSMEKDEARKDQAIWDRERKRRAKRLNERLKLFSTLLNGLGVAFVATSILTPIASGRTLTVRGAWTALGIVIILAVLSQMILHFWKSEE